MRASTFDIVKVAKNGVYPGGFNIPWGVFYCVPGDKRVIKLYTCR